MRSDWRRQDFVGRATAPPRFSDDRSVLTLRYLARRWPVFLDGACDALLVSFAAWTIYYQLALQVQFSMLPAGWPWVLLTVLLVVGWGLRAMRSSPGTCDAEPRPALVADVRHGESEVFGRAQAQRPRRWVFFAVVLLMALLAGRAAWGVWPAALMAIGLLVVQLWQLLRERPARSEPVQRPPSRAAHLFALGASVGFGVVGSFLLRPDADDVFYVNRATWVAAYGTAALNDTMFGPNTDPSATNAGIPTPSIEAAQGVLAAALGIQAPTLCYVVAVPALGTLAGWTTWRLIRAWASRRQALVMAAAMLFLLASADSVVGEYSLGRIWQGKATAYLILLPTVWLLLSRVVSRLRSVDLVLLAASGIAFVGLTTSSSLLAPVVAGAALLAALLLRSRSLGLGSLAFLAAPAINGIVQILAPKAIGGGESGLTVYSDGAFAAAFGERLPMVLLAVAAVILLPRSVPTSTGILLGCGAVVTMLGFVPGIFQLADLLTGAGAVAWRLVITLPTWVLVGLLAAWPNPVSRAQPTPGAPQMRRPGIGAVSGGNWTDRLSRWATPVLMTVVLVVPLMFGTWLWDGEGAQLTSRPTWKVDQRALRDVQAARSETVPPGRWLLPPEQMQILTISTITPSAVVPRAYYLVNLSESTEEVGDRIALYRLASGELAPVKRIRTSLERLDVSLACLREEDMRAQPVLARAVDDELKPIGDMLCHVGPPN